MAKKFQTKVIKSQRRFQVNSFTPEVMQQISDQTIQSIKDRIGKALTTEDSPARPLTKSYQKRKSSRGGAPIRDWKLTGRTLRSMKTLVVSSGVARIGFSDSEAAKRAAINNYRNRQFGLSPTNKKDLSEIINGIRKVEVK